MKSQHQKHEQQPSPEAGRIIEATRQACRTAAVEAWEDALIRGLCAEGAFEVAMGALDQVQVELKPQVPAPATVKRRAVKGKSS